MAFSKTPTKVTTIKEYGTTSVPDSVYPAASKTTQNNTSATDTYIPTGNYENTLNNKNSDGSILANDQPPSSNSNWANLKSIGEILVILITIAGVAWQLSKVDSKIDNVDRKVEETTKNIEKNSTKIDELKDKVSEISFKVQNLENNNSQINKSPEVKSK